MTTPLRSEARQDPTRVMRANDPDLIDIRSNIRKCLDALIRANETRGQMTALDANVSALADMLAGLAGRVDNLTAQVAALREAQPTTAPKDDINERIVAFLDSLPGVKLSPVVIGENIGVNESGRVAERCITLVNQRRIRRHVQPGRNPLYSSKKQAQQ